jgi:multidrug resistance efflux pump
MEASESQVRDAEQSLAAAASGLEYYLLDLPPVAEPVEDRDRAVPLAKQAGPAAARWHRVLQGLLRALQPMARWLATLGALTIATIMALVTWSYYVVAPWTRDGRVRVQVASVAPEVSGRITELHVADNQFVHKGDVLYVIDPVDFEVTLRSEKANLQQKAADLLVKQVQSERRQHLSTLATSAEEQQVFAGTALQAKAALDAVQQQVDQADVNLGRTRVRSPVNGYVTNLLMRVGDFARQGTANVSVIDTDSYWVDGYFEETKMARVCVGDRVEAKLMGYAQQITGHVATVTRGIGVSNAASGAQGLPNVDAVFTWVRLAQRIPVRIAIDQVPLGVPLVSGMTATVTILEPADRRPWLAGVMATMAARLSDVLEGPPARPNCIPATTTERGPTQSLPVEHLEPPVSPGQLNPGLAPGMSVSPRNR